jgi:hypothetical protein
MKPELMISVFTNKLESMSILEKCGGEMVNKIHILCHEPCLVVFLQKKLSSLVRASHKVAAILGQ